MIQFDTKIYTNIEVSDDLLESFEEEGFTYLHCTYITSPRYIAGWWVNIDELTYLVNSGSKEKLKLLNAVGVPISPEKHYLKRFGDYLKFTLIFPAIPKDWKNFNLIEVTAPIQALYTGSKGMEILNIKRNNSGVYKVIIS